MSTKLFRVEDKALQDARVRAQSGDAFVLVLAPGKFRFFSTKEVLGFLSWTAVLGAGKERIDLDYGHDVPNGLHEFEARGRRVTYRAPDGKDYFGPTEGKIFLEVERPPTGTAFTHKGNFLNVRFESDGNTVVLNGGYKLSSS